MKIKNKIKEIITRCKQLKGDPHFIAMGMGAGVFVCATPTFPFQTFIAIALSFVIRGSIPAAVLGSIVAIPIIPFFYMGSYKIGMLFLGSSCPLSIKTQSFTELFQMGIDIFCAMMAGGVIIGFVCGIIAYFITLKIFLSIRLKQKDVFKKAG